MVSTLIVAAALSLGGQASDTTRQAREAFTACLRTYVDQSIEAQMEAAAFESAYPQQCAAQEAALRDAVIRRETGARSSRSDAEESARLEIEDARVNFSERYQMAMQPPQ